MSLPAGDLPPPLRRDRAPLRFDGTINIPTIVMLLGMLVGGVVSLVSTYNNVVDRMQAADTNLLQRINNNDGEIRVLKSEAATARADRTRDREEVQSNLRDINIKLDQLLWDRGNRAQAKGAPR